MTARDDIHQGASEHPYQVMIVDEQDAFRRKIRDILHGIGGFQVVAETTSCRMALESVGRVPINLVIANLTLADCSGVVLTARLKQLSTSPHVILFSTIISDHLLLEAALVGVDGYLLKETPTREIIRAFKQFERGGPAMQPTVITTVLRLLTRYCAPNQTVTYAEQMPGRSLATSIPVTPGSTNGHSYLSPQETRVYALLRLGQRNKQIAKHLAISPYTVSKHVQNILRKLGVANRTQAAYTSFEGDIDIDRALQSLSD